MAIDWVQIEQDYRTKKHTLAHSRRMWQQLKANTVGDSAQELDFLMQLAIDVNYRGSARLLTDVLEQVRLYKRWLELHFPDWSLDFDPSTSAGNSLFLDPFPELQIK